MSTTLSIKLESQKSQIQTLNGLIKSTIVLCPDLVEFPRLVNNIRNRYSVSYRKMKIERLKELAEKSKQSENDTEEFKRCFEEIMEKLKWIFFHENEEPEFKNNGQKQACMWLICTMFCDNLLLPNSKNVFYTGLGFGEYWAITYRMYQIGKISFKEAVYLSKLRGRIMNLSCEEFYTVSIKTKKKGDIYSVLPKRADVGILAMQQNVYHLYGKKEYLRQAAKTYNVKMNESIPFFCKELNILSKNFSKRFPHRNDEIDSQVIYTREVSTVKSLIEKEFYEGFSEEILRQEITCYEPYDIKEI